MKQAVSFLILLFCIQSSLKAQDTLPNFSVRNAGNNRVIIGWVNQFPAIRQISVQRSFDSLNNYKTILTVADPKAVQNGFADTKAPNDHMFYRLFYAMEGGAFYFTIAKKPVVDSLFSDARASDKQSQQVAVQPFPNSALRSFVPSFYVYTNRTGYLQLNLPGAAERKYNVKFFEEDGSALFTLKDLKESSLTLDKANFSHAGWFLFELYDGEKLLEKHKFYIAKDF